LPLIVASATPIRPPSSPFLLQPSHRHHPPSRAPAATPVQLRASAPETPQLSYCTDSVLRRAEAQTQSTRSRSLPPKQGAKGEGSLTSPSKKGKTTLHIDRREPRSIAPLHRHTPSHVSSRSWICVTIIPPPARTDYHARQDGDYRTLAISTGTTSNRAFSSPFDLHARTSLAPSLQLASWD
jgi:hypothetical protein